MDFLLAEISKKDKELKDSNVLAPGKSYFKRADWEAKKAEEYRKKCKRLKLIVDEDSQDSQDSQKSDTDTAKPAKSQDDRQLARKEVVRRLRERTEPVRLFGESDQDSYERLKKLEMQMPEIIKGFKNDLKAAMDQVDQQYLNEILQSGGQHQEGEKSKAMDVRTKEARSLQEIKELAKKAGEGETAVNSELCLDFWKHLLNLWGEELNSRSREEKQIFKGKLASATYTQTVSYLRPLLRQLKLKSLDTLILDCLVEVVKYLLEKDYLRANDAYLEMAIGNAPWPIGVTMVGIHARTGREKISARNVAHVLNDETQRKYIQGVKRLMTKCQSFYPTNPSKMVDYESEVH